ncbi:MAG TPA: choice-of-anchor J domain-containing protein [Anaerolineales bacterium]|nr:choice-of-anchor J domain-containing protein [Anaerolineales bacterium]
MESPRSSSNWIVWAAVAAVVACLCIIVIAAVGAVVYYSRNNSGSPLTLPSTPPTTEPAPPLSRPTAGTISQDTANTLSSVLVPENDPYELACRLLSVCNVSHTIAAPARAYQKGDVRKFWIMNSDTIENFQIDATLRYVTPHSYFWVENGVDAKDSDIAALMTAFEDKIYPTDRRFFGSEWSPGVDSDPHVHIVYARNLGASTGGYYSTPDEYNPLVKKYSNAAEMFVFNADGMPLNDEYTYGTLAHEFQHMIHWSLDRNETSWINEGFSELAAFINGYTVGGADWSYAQNPDLSLNDWTSLSDSPEVTSRHYGQAFLFTSYFLDRFGDAATQALVKHQENGLTGIDKVFQELKISDPQTGKILTADDAVLDWMLAMYIGDTSVGDGRYGYHNYSDAPKAEKTQTLRDCPGGTVNGSVNQFGPEYVEIDCTGDHTLEFTGSTSAQVLPSGAHSGKYAFWSNKGDESDMLLTREIDLTGLSGSVDLTYWTWYDIEEGWDYLYLEASTDGKSWKIIDTPACSNEDKSGNAYGCGYTGKSGGGSQAAWIQQTVHLSGYAGKKVQLRFEYVTDAALNGEGLLLDDISIAAANYSEDFESGDGGWQSAGFARIENVLPQTFRLALVKFGSGGTTVEYPTVTDDQTASIPVSLKSGERAVLLVTGTQRYTRLPAAYSIQAK